MARAFPPSFFRLSAGDVPTYAPLDGSRRADVCIVGGGFTGLSAAIHLAEAGADVVLIEADAIASGASGRNGGQIHSGLRRDVIWLEERFGFQDAKTFWDMSEEAKALLRSLIVRFAIPCDLRSGVIEALHKPSLLPDAQKLVRALTDRFRYDQVSLLTRDETVAALGTARFFGGTLDRGGGHLDPYRFALGLARAAVKLGATFHEKTPALSLKREGGPVVVTAKGEIRAHHVIVATDGRSGRFERLTRRRMVGINSFVIATEPLGAAGERILPGGESAADSRFVVRYWRKTADGRLLFGGGESNAGRVPADIASFVRPHLAEDLSASSTRSRLRTGGAASSRSPRRVCPSCARSPRTYGPREAIRDRAWLSRRSSASFLPMRRSDGATPSRPSPPFRSPHFRARHGCAGCSSRWRSGRGGSAIAFEP